ncbi:aminotransferase class V-fold PLP-dependent enzyme, partial [Mycobacterium tuberculosis]
MKQDPLLTSIMWGNNEIGSLNPIERISKLYEERNIFFHTDATQVIG